MTITIKSLGETLIGAKNPVWTSAEKTSISLRCKFSHYDRIGETENDGYLLFIASAEDVEQHGREIFAEAKAGNYGTIGDYVAPTDSE